MRRLLLDFEPIYVEIAALRECCEQKFGRLGERLERQSEQIREIKTQNEVIIKQQQEILENIGSK